MAVNAETNRAIFTGNGAGQGYETTSNQEAGTAAGATGGGAFLSPIARRMAERLKGCSAKIALSNIVQRLRGFDLDPFAAWMSQVFLEKMLGKLCTSANTRLPVVADICNSLEREPDGGGFDLVVGNPPYGRITLSPELRRKFGRGLYGHANLYGVLTDLALSFTRPGGVIAYVTPTSFLSGQYFKALRGLLGRGPASISSLNAKVSSPVFCRKLYLSCIDAAAILVLGKCISFRRRGTAG